MRTWHGAGVRRPSPCAPYSRPRPAPTHGAQADSHAKEKKRLEQSVHAGSPQCAPTVARTCSHGAQGWTGRTKTHGIYAGMPAATPRLLRPAPGKNRRGMHSAGFDPGNAAHDQRCRAIVRAWLMGVGQGRDRRRPCRRRRRPAHWLRTGSMRMRNCTTRKPRAVTGGLCAHGCDDSLRARDACCRRTPPKRGTRLRSGGR